jgi:hypothetical protein
MGFNAMQPGRVKKGDLILLVSFIVVMAAVFALVFLAVR